MNILKSISPTLLRRWTPLAIKCYKSGCNCYKCTVLKNCESITPATCRMKSVVLGLVRKFGKPA